MDYNLEPFPLHIDFCFKLARIDGDYVHVLARTQDGYMRLARMCASFKWPLYRIRPKLHMQAEIVLLSCNK